MTKRQDFRRSLKMGTRVVVTALSYKEVSFVGGVRGDACVQIGKPSISLAPSLQGLIHPNDASGMDATAQVFPPGNTDPTHNFAEWNINQIKLFHVFFAKDMVQIAWVIDAINVSAR